MVTAESLFAHALLRAGHKGLFFDRLDLGVADPLTLEETPRLAVGADLLGNARNRVYSPRLGRWVQRDPNGTGQTTANGQAKHGSVFEFSTASFLLARHQNDGPSAYGYLRQSPMSGTDPLGLFFFPETLETVRQQASQFKDDLQKVGMVDAVRMVLMRNMSGIYYTQMAVVDSMLAEFSGAGLAVGGAGLMAYETALNMSKGGGSTVQLLDLTADNFRANLQILTGLDRAMSRGFDAHHMIPQAVRHLLKELGIEDMLHNPLLGQWVEESAHKMMQPPGGGEYNRAWNELLQGLIDRGASPTEAREQVLFFIKNEVVPRYKNFGLIPLPWY